MVYIGAAVQTRLIDAAKRSFGSTGEALVRNTAQKALRVPLERVSYADLPSLLSTIERDTSQSLENDTVSALARALDQLRVDAEGGLSGRVIAALATQLGPASEPFLTKVCDGLGIRLEMVDRAHLSVVAETAEQDARALLGDVIAQQFKKTILSAGNAAPAGLVRQIVQLATQYLGESGAVTVRQLCRDQLELDLEELDVDGIGALARTVEREGPGRVAGEQIAAFIAAAQQAIVSPAEPLRARIVESVTRTIGMAGPVFLRDVCAKNGMPFEAVDHEHLMWLAEVMRSEAAALVGKDKADRLARDIRGFLTGLH